MAVTRHVTYDSATDRIRKSDLPNDAVATIDQFSEHKSNKDNPHSVTKAQIGLGNADNTSDLNKPISTAVQTALNNKVDKISGKGLSSQDFTAAEKTKLSGIATGAEVNTVTSVAGKIGAVTVTKGDVGLGTVDNIKQASKAEFDSHTNDKQNPHNVTKAILGLGNVDNVKQASKEELKDYAQILFSLVGREECRNDTGVVFVGEQPLRGNTFVDVVDGVPYLREDGVGDYLLHVSYTGTPFLRKVM